MPVSYMSMISTYSMGIIVDKKENKLTFIPDDKTIDDINKKSNSRYQAQRLSSASSISQFSTRDTTPTTLLPNLSSGRPTTNES